MVNSKKIKTEITSVNRKKKQHIIYYYNKKLIKKVFNYDEENEQLLNYEIHTQKLDSSNKIVSTRVEVRDENKKLITYEESRFNELGDITLLKTYSKEEGIEEYYTDYLYTKDEKIVIKYIYFIIL